MRAGGRVEAPLLELEPPPDVHPQIPSAELEMSFTLSYEPSTLTRLLSCHSTFERISRDSATPLVTLGR